MAQIKLNYNILWTDSPQNSKILHENRAAVAQKTVWAVIRTQKDFNMGTVN